jgi:hypothetical protein
MVYSSTRSILEQFELLPPNQRLKEFIIYTSGIDFGPYFQNKKASFLLKTAQNQILATSPASFQKKYRL